VSPPEGARKTSRFVAVCCDPDYCYTPIGGKRKIVPYMVACDLSQSEACSPDAFFTRQAVFLYKRSFAPRVEGNEPGVGDGPGSSGVDGRGNGGIRSGINNGIVWVEKHAVNVFVNGSEVVRHGDECWMNHKPVS
jgi:hypothetical protein